MMSIIERVREDIRTGLQRDPAARNGLEIVLMYPGMHALWLHRLAHWLWRHGLKLIARLVSYWSRAWTGVDIHPGARIGRRVFIDHGMGVVIGETAEVGNDVLLYQGVVLGGTSLEKGKRHPTVQDGVVIGAGAIVLGPITVGANARIGAGSVVVKDVPAGATVVGVPARMAGRRDGGQDSALDHGELPDPVVRALTRVIEREASLESRLQQLERLMVDIARAPAAVAQPHPSDSEQEQAVMAALRNVLDPEVGVNLVDLGLIRRVHVCGGEARVDMVLTTPTCPLAGELVEQVRLCVRQVPGIERVQVTLLDEPWQWQWFVTRDENGREVPTVPTVDEREPAAHQ
jgi:serine O-acetyltransferase